MWPIFISDMAEPMNIRGVGLTGTTQTMNIGGLYSACSVLNQRRALNQYVWMTLMHLGCSTTRKSLSLMVIEDSFHQITLSGMTHGHF
jgi:hypothetical protein